MNVAEDVSPAALGARAALRAPHGVAPQRIGARGYLRGATANLKLTYTLDHSVGARQCFLFFLILRNCSFAFQPWGGWPAELQGILRTRLCDISPAARNCPEPFQGARGRVLIKRADRGAKQGAF